MTRQQYMQGGLVVPYITRWTGERELPSRLEKRYGPKGAFLGYVDEHDHDRDVNGALWARHSIAPGKGRADFRSVHALRQRNAMMRSLCQVCGASLLEADHEQQLFLVKDIGRPIAEGDTTSAPAVCERCAPIAARSCPHLKTGYTAAWVTYTMAWGVAGTLHDLETLRPVPGMEMVNVSHLSPLIRQVVACRTVESLHGCTPVDLNAVRPLSR